MVGLLEEVVNVDSGSYDKAGVDAVGEVFRRFFERCGYGCGVRPETLGAGGPLRPYRLRLD